MAAGTASAVAHLLFLVGCAPALAARRPAAVHRAALRLAEAQARRLGLSAGPGPDGRRALRYLAARIPLGLLGGVCLGLLGLGAATGLRVGAAWVRDEPFDGMLPSPDLVAYFGAAGLVLLFLNVTGLFGVRALERRLVRRLLAPDPAEALRRRVAELAESRAGIVTAVDAERRRIERDLHDGLQQRLVALSMLIGRARRGRAELLPQAHEEAQRALAELREVAWRVYPSGLDQHGLADALAGVAERAGIPVEVGCSLAARPPTAVETVAYFVVSEAVTNAVKHSGAGRVLVSVRDEQEEETVVVRVEDDGCGGADLSGGGLAGLRRRVAAIDGRFTLDSPAGGPTVVTAVLPCG
ncbi:sensor histidine kinase [Nonomuraea longicatena]|uniref:sensor histidine kinase n=1 Tax=Nonomuraea longicatena TaxID=83682 RepID=UPI0031DCE690